jgi:hypothetical protein
MGLAGRRYGQHFLFALLPVAQMEPGLSRIDVSLILLLKRSWFPNCTHALQLAIAVPPLSQAVAASRSLQNTAVKADPLTNPQRFYRVCLLP